MMMKEDQIVIKACEQIVNFFSLPSCERNLTKPECERTEMENLASCSASGSKCH